MSDNGAKGSLSGSCSRGGDVAGNWFGKQLIADKCPLELRRPIQMRKQPRLARQDLGARARAGLARHLGSDFLRDQRRSVGRAEGLERRSTNRFESPDSLIRDRALSRLRETHEAVLGGATCKDEHGEKCKNDLYIHSAAFICADCPSCKLCLRRVRRPTNSLSSLSEKADRISFQVATSTAVNRPISLMPSGVTLRKT